jgi:hypothetical protein
VIPAHNQSGVLPPYLGNAPSTENLMAPYKVTLLEVAERFSSSNTRREIIRGLVSYRAELIREGITSGFQWIDGSFVEDVEKIARRQPSDVDIITFAMRPTIYQNYQNWVNFINRRKDLFLPPESKKNYKCDAYYVDMSAPPEILISMARYWFGLFSHQRDTFLWKGLLEVPLCDDHDVILFLNGGDKNAE